MKNLCYVVCIPNTCTGRKRRQTYIRADISPTTLRSLRLSPPFPLSPSFPLSHPLSLCLSAVWHQSLQRKGSCNRSSLSPPFALLFISLTVFHSTTNCKPWPLPVFLTRSNLKILSATSVTGGRRKRKGWCLPHFWTNKFASLKSDSMGGLVSQFETSMWPFLFHFTWRFKSNKAYLLAQSFLLSPVKRSFATL